MRRLWLVLVTVIALIGLVAAACAPEAAPPGEEEAEGEEPAPEEEEEEAAPAAPEAEVTNWKLQTLTSEAMRYYRVVTRIAERVEEMSGGQLMIETFPAGAIVPSGEEFDGVDDGVLNACLAGHMNQLDIYPAAGLFYNVVGGLTATQMQLWYRAGGGDELAAEMYEPSNAYYVGTPLLHPPEIWCHSTVPLETPDDITGLKIRAAGDPGEILARMGASTVMIPGPEVYESASRGVIDAFEYGGPAINWDQGFHEVADYLYLSPTRAPTGGSGLLVNEDDWADVSSELQAIVEYATQCEAQLWFGEQLVLNKEALDKYEDYGTQVEKLPEAIDEEFVKTAQEFYDEKASGNPFFARVLESMREFKELCELQDVR